MDNIYTPPEAAVAMLEERRQDIAVRSRVLEYLGGILPSSCLAAGNPPVAILANYLARGTLEDRVFAKLARKAGFLPYWATYTAERFTTTNPEKVDTIRPPILWGKGQRTRQWIVRPEKRKGAIGNLQTVFGCSSSAYQHALRKLVFDSDRRSDLLTRTFDMSAWYEVQAKRFGHNDGERLAPYYAVARTALITTFCAYYRHYDRRDSRFMREVIGPSVDKVKKDLGLSPVIVQMPDLPGMNETDLSFLNARQAEQVRTLGGIPPLSGT